MSFLNKLIEKGVLEQSQLSEIVRLSNQKYKGDLEKALIAGSFLAADDLLKLKGEYFNLPTRKVETRNIPANILKYIPEDAAVNYKFIPTGIKEGMLEIGVVDPENIQAMDALQFISAKINIPFKLVLISRSDFDEVVENYHGLSGEVDRALDEVTDISDKGQDNLDDIVIETKNVQETLKPGEEEKIVEEAPIIKIVSVIIRNAVEGGASDIHVENTGEKVKVRFRVNGILNTSLVLPLNVFAGVVARIKILSNLRLDEKRKPQDGGFSVKFEGRKIDFRVSTLPTYYGEKVVMRILDSGKGIKKLDELGLSSENLEMLRESIKRPYGLILITGPTGSGKTTTLYSILNELDREKSNVVSLEDPVEYHIEGVNQSQVMAEIGYTFASGLRSILRQDPNIILVGEIRDKETAQLAIQAALTGHLVLSTLHTNNAIGAVPRLVDMGIDPYLIAPTLILTVAQRLVRELCPESKKALPLDEGIKIMIEKQFSDLPLEFKNKIKMGNEIYEAVPSPGCPSGIKGRIAVYEMYKTDKEVQGIILKNPTDVELFKALRAKGMLTMKEDAILKALNGKIAFQEIYNF